ncbi:multi-sensor signal transduction histidine kinase [Halogeometricum pallidum JCM 14848]|uniref:histidine kinase n=1 Tax=Halogeometricum pallidum JCM 14848 TaxID=1227487 RepID=M0DBU0_HALPD|nr:HAMP domain-containing sensor histidine kinase [Halogeometricum pallidum]ELZ32931.1 multi-sensor signal transduction histidine kinase [Halogeometricum pallidum JCM 14848]
MTGRRFRWETVAGWTPALVGLGLWGATAAHVLGAESPVDAAAAMWLPLTAGAGFVAVARRRQESRYNGAFALWVLSGIAVGILLNEWFFLLLSSANLRSSVDLLVVNANAIAAIATFTALIGHYYTNMQERVDELRVTNERLEDFASVVSHDLRNPLNIVQGHVALARETGERRHFDAIERATERMEQLIREVLALSRTGDAEVRFEPVDLGSVARKAASTVDDGTVRVVVEGDLTVTANAERLRSLLENLVRNAAEHGGPEVTTVRIGASADGSGFYVEDDGRGIPPVDRERVFEGGYSTGGRGTGFGLSIVRRVAEVHDWAHAAAESETGGARFEFSGVGRP